jgi:hypothetical protein
MVAVTTMPWKGVGWGGAVVMHQEVGVLFAKFCWAVVDLFLVERLSVSSYAAF